jgi:hypothetical protein
MASSGRATSRRFPGGQTLDGWQGFALARAGAFRRLAGDGPLLRVLAGGARNDSTASAMLAHDTAPDLVAGLIGWFLGDG